MLPFPVIAIDGPAGAGKSTVARALARRLGFFLLDTGAIYRSLALFAEQHGVSWADGPRLGALAEQLPIRFGRGDEDGAVYLAEQTVTTAIRTPEVSLGASQVSAHPEVRAMLLELQRQLSRSGPCVVEGRDIGTVVLPDAPLKIFLTASPEVRAQRRQKELEARGVRADVSDTRREQEERDRRDLTRATAPLKCADDAVLFDTSDRSLEQVIDDLAAIAKIRLSL
ncbi:MAG: (d)CMP kinase [Myxococcales bacterium]|nr:(d)CMP kinase [Myxococcales bacterium]